MYEEMKIVQLNCHAIVERERAQLRIEQKGKKDNSFRCHYPANTLASEFKRSRFLRACMCITNRIPWHFYLQHSHTFLYVRNLHTRYRYIKRMHINLLVLS